MTTPTEPARRAALQVLNRAKRDFLNASAPYTNELAKLQMMQPRTMILDTKTGRMETQLNWSPAAKQFADGLNKIIDHIKASIFERLEVKLAIAELGGTYER